MNESMIKMSFGLKFFSFRESVAKEIPEGAGCPLKIPVVSTTALNSAFQKSSFGAENNKIKS